MSKNDDKILELKTKINKKKAAIKDIGRFTPLTSCSLDWCGVRYNLHAADKDTLILLLCQLHAVGIAADQLGLLEICKVCGFPLADWVQDIGAKLDAITQKEELNEMKIMEERLNKLLSDDKKTELELASIAAALEE